MKGALRLQHWGYLVILQRLCHPLCSQISGRIKDMTAGAMHAADPPWSLITWITVATKRPFYTLKWPHNLNLYKVWIHCMWTISDGLHAHFVYRIIWWSFGFLYIDYTVRCRYNAVSFLKHIHKLHRITRPWGRGVRCVLGIQHLVHILAEFLQSFVQYLTILDRVITALSCSTKNEIDGVRVSPFPRGKCSPRCTIALTTATWLFPI